MNEEQDVWTQNFEAIKRTLTPEGLRALVSLTENDNAVAIQTGFAAARIVHANDRMAALCATMLLTGLPAGYDPELTEDIEA